MRKRLFLFIFNTILFSISNVLLAQNKAVFLSDSTQWADSVIATLSQDERIAQLFMVAAYSNKDELHKQQITDLVRDYKIGGVMFLQGGPLRQANLTNYLLESDLDMSYNSCFKRDVKSWHDVGLTMVKQRPILMVTIGYAKQYRRDLLKEWGKDKLDYKPDIKEIVKWL